MGIFSTKEEDFMALLLLPQEEEGAPYTTAIHNIRISKQEKIIILQYKNYIYLKENFFISITLNLQI